MKEYLPYIATIVAAIISGLASYFAARKQSKSDLQKMQKQFELDIEKEREKFVIEKERMEIEHKHQLELKDKEMQVQLYTDLVSTTAKEYMRSPAGQAQMKNTGKNKR